MSNNPSPRPRRKAKNTFMTRSGKTIKLNRSLSDRIKAGRDAKARRKAAYLSTLPKEPWKRALYRLNPRRLKQYWFSRDGAIMALKATGIGFVVVFLLIVGLFAYFRKDLPRINDISGTNLGGSITYYDRTGQTVLWQDYDAIKRLPVADDQISPFMKAATVAVEDKDFYHEGAFNVRGIIRAAINDAKGGSTQGGSTITQQLVKLNAGWTNDHTIARKVKELILAVELEREYSKQDILNGYLNIAPYGGVDYGVESASRDYFGVSAKQLTLPQAAFLAAIPKAPGQYSPYSSPKFNPAVTEDFFNQEGLLNRQRYIIDLMVKQGYISKKQGDDAKKVDILAQVRPLQTLYSGIRAPYFVLAAKQELTNRFGAAVVNRGGWKVTTTLDMNLQNTAEKLVADNWANIQRRSGGTADEEATVTEDVQTGQIVALVGGVDFSNPDHGQNNYAAGILIPPGSSFKPYDYAALIDNNTNVGAGSVLFDQDGPLPGYPCTNKALPKQGGNCLKDYDFLQPGPLTLRYALGGSRNVPAVKAMLSAVPNDKSAGRVNSINKVISTATAMMANPYIKGNAYNCYSDEQLKNTTQCYGASAIGDGAFLHLDDHVNGLATLARMGSAIPKTYILKITNAANKPVYQWTQPKASQALKVDSAYIVNDMASDWRASYLPGSCSETNCSGYKFHRYQGWHFAIKTGTTNNGFDGLMASWSTKYAVVSWVGNHRRNVDISARGSSMEYFTEPLTQGMMQAAHSGQKPVNWVQPAGIKVLPAFIVRKHIHFGDVEPSPSNDLFPSWYVGGSKGNTSLSLDKVSNKLVTSCTPNLAKQNAANSNVASWNIDIFMGGSTSSGSSSNTDVQTATDDVHNCNDVRPSVQISSVTVNNADGTPAPPNNGSYECTTQCKVTVIVVVQQGTHPFNDPAYPQFPGTVNLLINGQTVQSQPVSESGSLTFKYDLPSAGSIQVGAQVIDSVLYDSQADPQTITTSIAPPAH